MERVTALPDSVLREAFGAANEKHFGLARVFYRLLLGPEWRYCLLGFSYVKCVDDIVDVDPVPDRALALLESQLDLMERVYSTEISTETSKRTSNGFSDKGSEEINAEDLPHPARFGYYLFTHDRDQGGPLRQILSDIMETMSFDVRRKGRVLSEAELREHAVKVGATSIRFLGHFVDRGVELPAPFLRESSLAYLKADNLIDLEADLADGIINIPAEEIEREKIVLEVSDAGMRRWVETEATRVASLFERAREETSRLTGRKMRFLARVYMWRKRRAFLRFLERRTGAN